MMISNSTVPWLVNRTSPYGWDGSQPLDSRINLKRQFAFRLGARRRQKQHGRGEDIQEFLHGIRVA